MLSGNTIEQVITDCNEFINTDKLDSIQIAYNAMLSFDLANKRVILTHWIWLDHIAQVKDKQFIYTAKE